MSVVATPSTNTVIQTPYSLSQLLMALASRKRVPLSQFQPLTIQLKGLSISEREQRGFFKLFDCTQLPISYLFNVAYRHLGQLLAQAKIPSRLLGLIHLSSSYQLLDSVNWLQPFDLTLSLTNCINTEKGLVYQLDIYLIQAGQVRLTCRNQVLDKDKSYGGKQQHQQQVVTTEPLPVVASNILTSKLARTYAKVSGDYNPIHLSPWLAKLFGMKTSVMHGMYNLHWSLSKLPNYQQFTYIEANFNRPCLIPNAVELVKVNNVAVATGMDKRQQFALFSNQRIDRHLQLTVA